ncbi:MAG: TnsA-like heteromeric transposase endonuclease subunit [Streptosporangiaceae bacterium]
MDVAALGLGCDADLRFSVEYVREDGTARRVPLAVCAGERFEDVLPVRSFHWAKGAAHFPGSWWSSTTRAHVGFESWLERDHVMLMDFDPGITGIASQPFWLHWHDEDGRPRRHAPDFFARRADGGGVVVDVRPDDRIPAQDAEVFRATAAACGQAGWEFRRAGTIDPVVRANVRWLSRYRHQRSRREPAATALLEAFAGGRPLLAGAARAGDLVAVLPVAYHLLWRRELCCDLSVLLDAASMTWQSLAEGNT